MNYKGSLDWLDGFQRFGMKLGLERIRYICRELGNPQKEFKAIHVGGTNGKGSVCKFLESIFLSGGYTVGVYISPHLQRFSERIVVDGKEIPSDDTVSLIKKVKPVVEKMTEKGDGPTYFEIVTAMAFQYFSDKDVDFAVVEVGLGGRYDATNIVDPVVAAITNVSLEHENALGRKIGDIALEKAGIIKNNVPVITGAKEESLKLIKNVAKERNAPVSVVDDNEWERLHGDIRGQEFLVKRLLKDYTLKTSMLGRYQGENIAIALAVIENLQMNGVYIPDDSIVEGIAKAVNPGRMEVAGYDPVILLDGAHNPTGIQVLKEALKDDFDYDKLIVVLGILSDKDIKSMLSIIVPIVDAIVTTKSHNNRACDPSLLKEMIKKLNYKNEVVVKDHISDAIKHAKSIAKKDDLICITGSLFTVGEARDCLVKNLQKC